MPEFVFTLHRLRKALSADRVLLDDITLAFLPGAKIGVLGPNGSGKSTLLKIMAGVDTEFIGEARPAPGLRIGFLPQEPQLDPSKNVLEIVQEGVAEMRALLERFEEVSAKFAEPMDDDAMQKLLDEQARIQDQIEAAQRLGARSHARDRDGCTAAAAERSERRLAFRRREASRSAVPACCYRSPTCSCWTSRPTISMPSP